MVHDSNSASGSGSVVSDLVNVPAPAPFGQIRPCLIGGFSCKNVSSDENGFGHVSYFNCFEGADGLRLSCDSIRLTFKLQSFSVDLLAVKLDTLPDVKSVTMRGGKPGSYRWLFTVPLGDGFSSLTVGLGLVDGSGKIDDARGMLDFNPNKCAGSPEFWKVFRWLSGRCRSGSVCPAEVKRWDFAVDMPLSRDAVRLAKDGRKYSCEVSAALTEYLGVRGQVGRVKLYDKQAESGLESPLTRLEVTCAGDDTAADVLGRLPLVYGLLPFPAVEFLSRSNRVLALALADRASQGLPVEDFICSLDPRARKPMRSAIGSGSVLELDESTLLVFLPAAVWNWQIWFSEGLPDDAPDGGGLPFVVTAC